MRRDALRIARLGAMSCIVLLYFSAPDAGLVLSRLREDGRLGLDIPLGQEH